MQEIHYAQVLSGGKDSTYNMIKCVEAGHEVVALANLYPVDVEELDSYMYQSVGHDVIVAYGQCMELPLYRQPITGRPLNQAYEYEPTEEDEVEDLYRLLCRVLQEHPTIAAVSSGAIMSNYQKNRVENVCSRLGLLSLAYLWQAEQASLLQQMIDSHLNAIIIKVAAHGLDVGDLGCTLQGLQPKLQDLANKYGINVCGEGGEFESLTLDCPLFPHKRLVIDETKVQVHRDKGITTVAFLKIVRWHLADKN